jgi:hypothetical protein
VDGLFHAWGTLSFAQPLHWTIDFGSYSAAPNFRDMPTWLIRGTPDQTDYGPCGPTILAPYDADTGRTMGLTLIG